MYIQAPKSELNLVNNFSILTEAVPSYHKSRFTKDSEAPKKVRKPKDDSISNVSTSNNLNKEMASLRKEMRKT